MNLYEYLYPFNGKNMFFTNTFDEVLTYAEGYFIGRSKCYETDAR